MAAQRMAVKNAKPETEPKSYNKGGLTAQIIRFMPLTPEETDVKNLINQWLHRSKKTQLWLAAETGISKSVVNRHLAGTLPVPTRYSIAYARAFGVTPAALDARIKPDRTPNIQLEPLAEAARRAPLLKSLNEILSFISTGIAPEGAQIFATESTSTYAIKGMTLPDASFGADDVLIIDPTMAPELGKLCAVTFGDEVLVGALRGQDQSLHVLVGTTSIKVADCKVLGRVREIRKLNP